MLPLRICFVFLQHLFCSFFPDLLDSIDAITISTIEFIEFSLHYYYYYIYRRQKELRSFIYEQKTKKNDGQKKFP